MPGSENTVMLVGCIGEDPALEYNEAGTPVVTLQVGTGEQWTDKKTGEVHDCTEWHNVSIVGKSAEEAHQHLHRGAKAYFEGVLKDKTLVNRAGRVRQLQELVVDAVGQFLLLSNRGESGDATKVLNLQ